MADVTTDFCIFYDKYCRTIIAKAFQEFCKNYGGETGGDLNLDVSRTGVRILEAHCAVQSNGRKFPSFVFGVEVKVSSAELKS